ncbi:MAG: T9SS type A sorting domain-containing protein [Muribaculaceae bacterium]|nr:T9SS type A sorting domain-containing protein [Muribaculaceae bacterium]
MKKFGLLVACALGSLCATADTTVNLIVNTNGGEPKKYDISTIDFIDFNEDQDMMNVHLANTVDNIEIDNIEDMVFDIISGIEEIRDYDLADGLNVSINGGILNATQDGKTITVRIFDMNGRMLDMVSAESEISYSLADLDKGTYIVMVNDKAVKFIR